MKANEVLLWLSARREGSWHQFRDAVEQLHSASADSEPDGITAIADGEFPLHQQLRLHLECLAHAEFFKCDSKYIWRVAPPVLAAHQEPRGIRAVLCGARSPALRERLLVAGQHLGCETLNCSSAPEVIRLTAPEGSALAEVAAQARVHFQPDAPQGILSNIWPCDPPSRRLPQSEFPVGAGWRIREFDALNLAWLPIDRQRSQTALAGVFEFRLYDRWLYFLRSAGRTFKMPRGVALYAHLRCHQGILRYDAQARILSLPGVCRPPRLLERALALCSGFPPSFDRATARLIYADVPPEIAHFAAGLLRQPLV